MWKSQMEYQLRKKEKGKNEEGLHKRNWPNGH
jgi:hypothetical protein